MHMTNWRSWRSIAELTPFEWGLVVGILGALALAAIGACQTHGLS
jgi:hypothetical protein